MKKKLGLFLLDLLYPRRCPFCEEVLGFELSCACEEHIAQVRLALEPLQHERGQSLDEMWACFGYGPPVSEACHRLKYENQKALAKPLGAQMAWVLKEGGALHKIDGVVPVPMTERAEKERGYNQSELLAQEICRLSNLPLQNTWLTKTRETKKQRTLGRSERYQNVKGAFSVPNPEALRGKSVLLVDDVTTTASTLSECAKTLKEGGAEYCASLTLLVVHDQALGFEV